MPDVAHTASHAKARHSPVAPVLASASGIGAIGAGAARTRRDRTRVLLFTLAAQALLLAAGWFVTMHQTRDRVSAKFQDEIVASNVRTVEAVREKLATLAPGGMRYGDPNWNIAQSVIESIKMPADGFACLIDETGHLLCHPDIRDDPSLREVNLGAEKLRQDAASAAVALRDLSETDISAGTVSFGGIEKHYLATAAIPGMNARLLVHQPVAGLLSAGEAATGGVLWLAMGIGGVVLLGTAMTTHRLMRRHDAQLEAINTGLESEVGRRIRQAMTTRDSLIFGLAKLADYRDTDTGTHLERIAEYSELLARELAKSDASIDEAYIHRLRVASSMHDIGKVGVEDTVLLKPGKLTGEELARMQRHPVIGADTLIAIREKMGRDDLLDMAIVVTLEHHERWDGKGYPLGLSGEDIELAARIVALADVYDALTSKRVYKDAMSHGAAAGVIVKERGTQFDPRVVDAFVACGVRFAQACERLQGQGGASETPKMAA